MAEWSMAAVLKTVNRKVRGFESCSLRQKYRTGIRGQGPEETRALKNVPFLSFPPPKDAFEGRLRRESIHRLSSPRKRGSRKPLIILDSRLHGNDRGSNKPCPLKNRRDAREAEWDRLLSDCTPLKGVPGVRIPLSPPYLSEAPIAQLDRASDYESEGRRFEPCWAYQSLVTFHPGVTFPVGGCRRQKRPFVR